MITTGKKLTDIHISAAQKILHNEFPDINGLQNTGQLKYPLFFLSYQIASRLYMFEMIIGL